MAIRMRDFTKKRLTDECVRDWPQFEAEFIQEAATKLFNLVQNGPVTEAILEKSIKEEEVATKNKERRQELEAIAQDVRTQEEALEMVKLGALKGLREELKRCSELAQRVSPARRK